MHQRRPGLLHRAIISCAPTKGQTHESHQHPRHHWQHAAHPHQPPVRPGREAWIKSERANPGGSIKDRIAYGAKFELTPREKGIKGCIARAMELLESAPGAWMPQQFENPANIGVHVRTTAAEIAADFPKGVPPADWQSRLRGGCLARQLRVDLAWRLSRTETWLVPSLLSSNSWVAASNLVSVA